MRLLKYRGNFDLKAARRRAFKSKSSKKSLVKRKTVFAAGHLGHFLTYDVLADCSAGPCLDIFSCCVLCHQRVQEERNLCREDAGPGV